MVARLERAAQAEQDARQVVLGHVAEGKAQHDAHHAGRTQHGGDQGGGFQQVQRHQQAGQQQAGADGTAHQRAQVGVAAVQPHDVQVVGQPASQQVGQPHHAQRHQQQRHHGHGAQQAFLGDVGGFGQAGAEVGLQDQLVLDRHHAVDGADHLGGQLARVVVGHVAVQVGHAGLHRRANAREGRVARQPRGDVGQDALVVLLRFARGALHQSGVGRRRGGVRRRRGRGAGACLDRRQQLGHAVLRARWRGADQAGQQQNAHQPPGQGVPCHGNQGCRCR